MDEPNKAPEAGAPITDPSAAAAAPLAPASSVTAPPTDAQPPAGAPPDAPALLTDAPKRTASKRKAAPAKAAAWYATKAFRTQYQGVMLEFKADQLLDDEIMAEWLADTGSPVEYLEG